MRSTALTRARFSALLASVPAALALPMPALAAPGTITIGVDMPMSGGDAASGIPTANGVLLAVEEANKRGLPGGYKLQANVLDDCTQGKHDPAAGAQNVKTFIADSSVLAMVGPFNSNVAKAQIPLTNDAGLVQISASTTNDGLTVGDDAKKLRFAHPDVNAFFRVCTRDTRQGLALAKFAQKLGFKRVFIVDDNETYGKGLADVFDASFRSSGGTVLGHEHLTPNQVDFKPLLTKAKSLNPDLVFFGGVTVNGGGLVRRQMGDVGLHAVPYLGGDGLSDSGEFVKEAGPMVGNVYFSVAAPDTSRLPSAKAFVAAYTARFKAPVGGYSASAYAAAVVEIAAIEKALKANGGKLPTRAEVLKNVAESHDVETPIGKLSFDAAGDTTSPVLTFRKYQPDGKIVTVDVVVLK